MSDRDDPDYYLRRALVQMEIARRTRDPGALKAHQALVAFYLEQADMLKAGQAIPADRPALATADQKISLPPPRAR